MSKKKVAIIGGGPAGLCCGIQLHRYAISGVVYEKNRLGGLLRNAWKVENSPGFPQGISGDALADRLIEQARCHNLEIVTEEVKHLIFSDNQFILTTPERCERYDCVVIASGTRPRKLDLFRHDGEHSPYVFYDVLSLRRPSRMRIGVIGGGDAAFDYALTLSEYHSQVLLFHRGEKFGCLPLLRARAGDRSNLRILPSRTLVKARVKDQALLLEFRYGGGLKEYSVDAVVTAVGREPELGYVDLQMKRLWPDLVSSHRIFPIGDVGNDHHRQFAIAAGDGITAAMEINDLMKAAEDFD